jgi:mRNA interferase MazF
MVKARRYVPERGDVVRITLSPQAGREQAGRRPALVLSPASYNGKVGLGLMCPLTNKAKGYPFEVAIPAGHPVTGVVLADHVRSLDWGARQADYVCSLPEEVVQEVLRKLRALLPGD